MIREVTLSRHEATNLLNKLERIEASDGRPGFCRKELKRAGDLLTRKFVSSNGKVLFKNRRSITARPLYRFLSQLREAHRKFSQFKEECRDLVKPDRPRWFRDPYCEENPLLCLGYKPSLANKACKAMFYSLEMIIYEGKNSFEVLIKEVPKTISYEVINPLLQRIKEGNWRFPPLPPLDSLPIDPMPGFSFPPKPKPMPGFPFPSKSEPIDHMPIPRYPPQWEVEIFPPRDYESIILPPVYLPDVHKEEFWNLYRGVNLKY